jgi:hypothetical protein
LLKGVLCAIDRVYASLNYPISPRNPQGYPDPIPRFDEEKIPDV